MGSMIEINDTLRISKTQGFPAALDIKKHLTEPIPFDLVRGKVFSFKSKPKIRIYQQPPVRTFLVEDYGGGVLAVLGALLCPERQPQL
ncbi:hypothetical protein FWD20_03480 [Candidatus Saccharibacteria bacterium]|nr:hypothetical protein [Candidatus Saccharibacteria bacterium]